MNTYLKWALPIGSAAVAALIVTAVWFNLRGPATEPETTVLVREVDFVDITSDLDSLTRSADVVVMGTVEEIVQSGHDRGKEGTGRPMAYTLYKLSVQEELKGDVASDIYVYQTNPGVFPEEAVTRWTEGDLLVLYLESVKAYLPIAEVSPIVYVPLALDNGVFDVLADGAVGVVSEETVIRPRGISQAMFAEGTTFTAGQIREAIAP